MRLPDGFLEPPKKGPPWFTIGLFGILGLLLILFVPRLTTGTVTSTTQDMTGRPEAYLAEYGGDEALYEEIFSLTRCLSVQTQYERANGQELRAQPGSEEARAAAGYKRAAQDRYAMLRCGQGGSTNTRPATLCTSASRTLLDRIEAGLTVQGGGSLPKGVTMRSSDFESVYFVAAEIDGPGMDGPGEIGLWATNRLDSGLTIAVDAIAVEFSDWPAGASLSSPISQFDDGGQEALRCLQR
jgi:hypothetical protein